MIKRVRKKPGVKSGLLYYYKFKYMLKLKIKKLKKIFNIEDESTYIGSLFIYQVSKYKIIELYPENDGITVKNLHDNYISNLNLSSFKRNVKMKTFIIC